MTVEPWDVVVIGSGFGGSVCALRAAEAGLRTAVLERGARMTPAAWDELARGDRPFVDRKWSSGLIQRAGVRGLMALSGNAVGGTSQIYTAVTMPPAEEIFEQDWPSGWDAGRMRPFVTRVQEMIGARVMPCEVGRTRVLEEAGRTMGAKVTRLPLAMDWGTAGPGRDKYQNWREEMAAWLQGGVVGRKRTIDQTYLARAESAGARVFPLHEAVAIAPRDGGYLVRVRRRDGAEWIEGGMDARRVVVAAGTLNTVGLLLRCRDELRTLPRLSAALGRQFYTNGDFGGLLIVRRDDLRIDLGPAVTAWVDLWRSDRMYLMDTGFVPVFQRLIGCCAELVAAPGAESADARTRIWSFGVMGFDATPGTLVLDSRGGLVYAAGEGGGRAFRGRATERMRELAAAVGARLIAPPEWLAGRRAMTVHPLGGAGLADSPERGVASPSGEVFGYPGLFVADGSLLPTPVGRAPSVTIAALAEHVGAGLVASGGSVGC